MKTLVMRTIEQAECEILQLMKKRLGDVLPIFSLNGEVRRERDGTRTVHYMLFVHHRSLPRGWQRVDAPTLSTIVGKFRREIIPQIPVP